MKCTSSSSDEEDQSPESRNARAGNYLNVLEKCMSVFLCMFSFVKIFFLNIY